jgi:UDP-2-acetamido-3-amino-2,3-dideoxy-glucuronate N-acetyltransferase
MKLSLIGGGYWGKNLIREFNNVGILHTICDINEEALQKYKVEYPNVNITSDWNNVLLNNDITSVCIALPAEMHYEYCKNSLLANKDVYVEKPITLNISHAEELISIAKEKNKILMVGHLLHYHPCVEKMKEIIKLGKIGNIKTIIANRFSLGIFRKHENVLWSFAPHDISVILSLLNDKLPNSVICHGSNNNLTEGIEDIVNCVLKYSDKYINININWLSPNKEQRMTIIGETGIIVFDDTLKENKLKYIPKYFEKNNNSKNIIPIKGNEEYPDMKLEQSPLYKECMHFKNSCENKSEPITTGEEGLRVLKVLDGLSKSLKENREICLNEKINNLKYFVHETAIIDADAEIGEGTKIWHFSHICKGAKIGKNCNIGQNVFISGGAKIGDNCKVQNNVSIYAGVEAEDYVFFGPSCVLTNDINPRCMHSKNGQYLKTVIKKGVTLGANCTIVCGNTIGEHSLIGSGAVICKNVEPYSIMVGNPGKKIGTIDEKGERKLEY